jgi:prevent-host-death family protein
MTKIWQASDARQHFADLVEAAVHGQPQFVTRRDGKEVVVVSRSYFDKTRPTLKDFLLTAGFADDGEDDFDRALQEIDREDGGRFGSGPVASGFTD